MAQDPVQSQQVFMRSIDQYIDRHAHTGQGPKDLQSLQSIGAQNLFQAFGSTPDGGLSTGQVQTNGQKYGLNQYRKRSKRTLCQIFKQAITDEMLIILMVAAVVSVIVQYFAGQEKDMFWVDGLAIMVAVIVCTLVSTISNYKKQQQFDQLDKMTQSTYNYQVLRDGRRQEVHRTKIVAGDMIFLSNGMQIPADCLLYRAVNVIVNESAITGQTNQVYKNTMQKCLQQKNDPNGPTPLMISGSNIVSGQGIMMATVVGKDSRAGKNFQLIFSRDDDQQASQTPLQIQLQKLASQVGRFGIMAAIFIFVVLLVRLLIQELSKGGFDFKKNIQKIIHYLIIAVTVVVVSIPQGLPLAVTLTLAYSMKAMHKDKILVRKLESCQTMGAARYLCSDKTGTITQNKMNVMQFVNNQNYKVDQFNSTNLSPDFFTKVTTAMFHNTSAIADPEKGAQTQIALIKLARKATGQTEQVLRKQVGPNAYFKRLPFDSSRKRMTTGMRVGNEDLLFMNGASEQILAACNTIQDCKTNNIQPISQQLKNSIQNSLNDMAGRGYRTVAVAYKKVNGQQLIQQSNRQNRAQDVLQQIQKQGFTLLAIFGIEDPPRQQSRQAILNCHRAGIHVIMVTGDNKITAQNIAQQVGITQGGKGKVLQASQLMKAFEDRGLLKDDAQKIDKKGNIIQDKSGNKMKKIVMNTAAEQQAFQNIISDLVVVARSKPQHKYILVDGINKLGHVVGVTGDGANDAPALMRADIGLAMGITGTQVSKNASDIIILDDNFNSIVRAVVWGRNVYASIRKFLQFQLTVNIIAVCIVLISAAVIRQSVLASVQMLWVNLIMDSLAALALATEPPNTQQLLKQQPNSPSESLVTKTMLKHIIGQAIFQLIILCGLLFFGQHLIPEYRDSFDDVIGTDLQAKYFNGVSQSTVTDGKFYTISGHDNYKVWYDKYHNHSRHFTFIFNVFVFLQVFNFICCRRIKDQLNIFNRICSSKLFWIIVIVIVALQILVITFGGRFFQLYRYGGLTIIQWLISVGLGALTLPMTIFLRLLPFCKPNDSIYVKRPSLLEKKTKKVPEQQNIKSIQSSNRPYIKPVKTYNHHDSRSLSQKLASKIGGSSGSAGASNVPMNIPPGTKVPYGYQYNASYNMK